MKKFGYFAYCITSIITVVLASVYIYRVRDSFGLVLLPVVFVNLFYAIYAYRKFRKS